MRARTRIPLPEHRCPRCGTPRHSATAHGDDFPGREAADILPGTLMIARCCGVRVEVVEDGVRARPDLSSASFDQLVVANRQLYGLAPEVP